MSESKEIGNVLYFDPNSFSTNQNGINYNPDLMKNPEDLSIAVDLQVTVRDKGKISGNNGNQFTYSLIGNTTPVNFLQGRELGGTNVLTDFFANIGDKEDEVENISEAMCVSSIDIEFSSWYAASVIINFTDVRGASLFTPSDYADTLRDKSLNNDIKNESLFKTFFSFPYPMYKLKIKGFYGDAVSYPLHCSDFKAQFNATTGNFDITVHFIGYTYAMLNDIQMAYLMAAPYCKYSGEEYWKSQIEQKRFLSSDGKPLPTLVELMRKIKKGEYEVNKISQSQFSKDLQDLKNQSSEALNIMENYLIPYLNSIKTIYKGVYATDNNMIVTNMTTKDVTIQDNFQEPIKTQIKNIDDKIGEFKKNFPTNVIFSSYSTVSDIKPQLKNNSYYEVNISEISKALTQSNKNLGNQMDDLRKKLDQEKNNTLTQAYGMEANIFNYFKVLVAHMETFYYMIESCANNIKKDRDFGNIPINRTDGNVTQGSDGKYILPPFPWYSQVGKGGKLEDAWIGNANPTMEEVDFIEKLIQSKIEIEKEVQEIVKTDGSDKEQTDIPTSNTCEIYTEPWYPINAFDNPISLIGGKKTNPWDGIINAETIYDRIYLRTLIPILLSNTKTDKNMLFDISEAYNIQEINSKIKPDINIEIDNLINIQSGTKSHGTFNSRLEYNNNTLKLPLYEDTRDGFKNINKKKWISINQSTVPESKNQTKFAIVKGSENIKNITDNYYLKLINKIKNLKTLGGEDLLPNLKNYRFLDEKNTSLTYSFFGNDESFKNIITNKICENKRPTIGTPYVLDTFKDVGIDINKLYNKNIDISELYKLYNNRNSLNTNDNVIKKYLKDENKKNLTYPFIGGHIHGNIFSLFGYPFYYQQNSKDNNISQHHKAFLFLNTLDIDIDQIENTLKSFSNKTFNTNNHLERESFMARMPYAAILLIGGLLWRFRDEPKNLPYKTFNGILLPNKYQYFKINKQFSLTTTDDIPYTYSNLFFNTGNAYENILDDIETQWFIKEFKNFVYGNEWATIRASFELKTLNNEVISAKKLIEIVKNLSETNLSDQEVKNKFYKGNLNNYINISEVYVEKKDENYNSVTMKKLRKWWIEFSSGLGNNIQDYEYGDSLKYLKLVNKDDSNGVKEILTLLTSECIIAYAGNLQNINNEIQITKQRNVLKSLKVKLNSLNNEELANALGVKSSGTKPSKPTISSIDEHIDANLSTYTYIKTIYDKWVSSWINTPISDKPYKWITKDVVDTKKQHFKSIPKTEGDYYIKNFRFIDRAHNDIGVDMLIDYRNLLEIVNSDINQKTLFSTMTDALQKNQMLFLPMPSYQAFDTMEDLTNVFKPLSFAESKMTNNTNDDLDSSMYLCMYAGRPSSKLNQGSDSNFADDSFSLNKPELVPADFIPDSTAKVPAIAVNFGQQNQQYFKNYTLNMSNPNTTDASIRVLQNLNERANQNSTVEPIGQDLFSLYSQYSYTCDVEMMGCAQIQPMMYFQLNNIPMWNGAYMIFKVKHSIKPGTMTTSFSGMRMAKTYPKLVTENAITFKLLDSLGGTFDLGAPTETGSDTKYIDIVSGKYFKDGDHFEIINYVGNETKITERIYNRLSFLSQHVEIVYSRWKAAGMPDFEIHSGYRSLEKNKKTGGASKTSAHVLGLAVDIRIANTNNQGRTVTDSLRNVVVDMMKEGINIDQCLLETGNDQSYYWVHIGLAKWDNGNPNPIIINGRYYSEGEVNDYKNHNAIPGYLIPITSAKWPDQGEVSTNIPTAIERKKNEKDVFDKLKTLNLEKYQVAAIMGNIFVETGGSFNPKSTNAKDNNGKQCYGLIQWNTGSYPYKNATLDELKAAVGNTVESQITYLTNMSNYSTWKNITYNEKGSIKASKSAYDFARIVEICWECTKGEIIFNNNTANKNRTDMAYSFYNRMFKETDQLYWI